MRYLVCPSVEVAETLTRLLWSVSRPERARHPNDVTARLFAVVSHSNGTAALVLVDGYSIPRFADLVVDQDCLDQIQAIMGRADAQRLVAKGRITVDELVSAATATVLTEEQAQAAGWFPEETDGAARLHSR